MSKEKETKPMTPARAFFDKFLFAFYIVALILAICFSSFVWFQKTYFSTYWVNGQSMWPTLNVETRDAQGRLFNENPGLSMNGATGVDLSWSCSSTICGYTASTSLLLSISRYASYVK